MILKQTEAISQGKRANLISRVGSVGGDQCLWGEKPYSLGLYGNFSRRRKTLILNLVGCWGEKPHSLGLYDNFSRRRKTVILNLFGYWGEKPHNLGLYGNFSRRRKTLM